MIASRTVRCVSLRLAVATAVAPIAAGAQSAAVFPNPAFRNSTLTCAVSSTPTGTTISYGWQVNNVAVTATAQTLAPGPFVKGNTVRCTVTFRNAEAVVGSPLVSPPLTIGNTAPVVSGVSLTPATAYRASTLVCTPVGADADGDPITFIYAWSLNGVSVNGATTSTLAGLFAPGNAVRCSAWANDGQLTGTSVASAPVTIVNDAAPTVSSVSPTTGPTAGGIELTIAGSTFGSSGATVTIATKPCPVSSQTTTSIKCRLPEGQGVNHPLVVTVGSQASSPFGYSYGPPAVKDVTPTTGPAGGGTSITIAGANFGTLASVRMGTGSCRVTSQTNTSITCTTPAGSGEVTVTVVVSGQLAANAPRFAYSR